MFTQTDLVMSANQTIIRLYFIHLDSGVYPYFFGFIAAALVLLFFLWKYSDLLEK